MLDASVAFGDRAKRPQMSAFDERGHVVKTLSLRGGILGVQTKAESMGQQLVLDGFLHAAGVRGDRVYSTARRISQTGPRLASGERAPGLKIECWAA